MSRKQDLFECENCRMQAPVLGQSSKVIKKCTVLKNCLNMKPIDPRALNGLINRIEDKLIQQFFQRQLPQEVKEALREADEELYKNDFCKVFESKYLF
jgi:hypothetical protein